MKSHKITQDTMQITVKFHIMIAGCLVLAGYTSGQSITVPPSDTTGLVGASTQLRCEVTFGSTPYMLWEHNGIHVYSFMHGEEDYPQGRSKYVVKNFGSRFYLEIKMLTLEDAGMVTCNGFVYTANAVLIVLDNPVMHIDPPDPVEGDSAKITCDVSFGGPKKELISTAHFPKLELHFEDETLSEIANEQKNYTLHKVYNLTVRAGMNGDGITCMIQTTLPVFNATTSTKLKVLYSARNITYAPQQTEYEVGSKLTCTVEGNPPPFMEWDDLAGKTIQGKQLKINESMAGPNKWKCTARNIIRGIMHFDSMIAEFAVVKKYDYESTSTDPVDDFSENENNSSIYWIIGLVLGIVVFAVFAVGIGAFIFVKKRKHQRSGTTPDREQRIRDKSNKNTDLNGMMMGEQQKPLLRKEQQENLLGIAKLSKYPLIALCQLMKLKEQRQELLKNPESLLQLIQTQADENSMQSRTEILDILVSEAQYISEEGVFIEWTDDFVLTLKELLEKGADPTCIHKDKTYTKTAQYAFFGAIQNILLEKSNLYCTIEKVLPLFLAKESNMQMEGCSTVLHALVNTDWEALNAKAKTVPLDFFTYYNNVIAEVIKHGPSIVDKQDENGATPLQLYIQDLKIQEKMLNPVSEAVAKLKSEKNINTTDSKGKTVLHYLTQAFPMFTTNITQVGQDAFLKMVRKITSDNNTKIKDCNGQTILHVLAEKYSNKVPNNFNDILCKLVKLWANKWNTDVQDHEGKTFLHILAKKYPDQVTSKDYMEIIRHVAKLSDRNIQDKEGCTVLHVIAQTYNNINQCKDIFLDLFKALATGADINIQNKNGDSVMHIFATKYAKVSHSDAKTLYQLMVYLNQQCNTLAKNRKGSTMLHIMMENYSAKLDQDLIGKLVKMCVNKDDKIVNIQDDKNCTALHILASRFPNQISNENSKPFLEMIKELATDKTRDTKDKRGHTALQVVATRFRKDMTECCKDVFPELVKNLKSPSNINFKDENGSTVLHTIASRVFYDPNLGIHILPLLPDLTTSENVNILNTYSTTPYSWILNGKEIYKDNREVQSTFIKIEEVFLKKGADANFVNLNCLI